MLQYFFVPEYQLPAGVGFRLFGAGHLIWLALLAAMDALMIYAYLHLGETGKRRLYRWPPRILICCELLRDVYLIARGAWDMSYLPLHMCSFTMFLMLARTIHPRRLYDQVLYGLGLVGAVAALLFCNWANQPLIHFQSGYSFLFHGTLVGWIGMLLASGELRPRSDGWKDCVKFLCVIVPVTGVINYFVEPCNFFFTNGGSEGSPLAVLVEIFGVPLWLAVYAAIALVILLAEFLPWKLKEK